MFDLLDIHVFICQVSGNGEIMPTFQNPNFRNISLATTLIHEADGKIPNHHKANQWNEAWEIHECLGYFAKNKYMVQ